jgi:GNAT superfamily N-acetyltransferase
MMPTVTLKSGESLILRPLQPDDALLFGAYLENLGAETRRRFGPHPLNREMAAILCGQVNPAVVLRLITLNAAGEMVAYFILEWGIAEPEQTRYAGYGIALDPLTDCTFAPSVADAYQSSGLGSAMLPTLLATAREQGRRSVVLMGGTQATNARAIHFYEKFGFRKVGEFMTEINNWDMFLEL